jgi:hypothetical protein
MKCEELLKMLNEYVDGTVDPGICEAFEKHPAVFNRTRIRSYWIRSIFN